MISSVHTRFDTLQILRPQISEACDPRDHAAILPPLRHDRRRPDLRRDHAGAADEPRHFDLGTGRRRTQFHPGKRDMKWRRSLGVDDDALAMAFLGRLVMEKGLDVFVEAIDILTNARSSIASW